jgi:CTP:molybdopterin cytidylyltransferase MocA
MLQYLSFDFFLEIKVGIPAYFPAASFADLVELRGDVGAREMLRGARVVVEEALALDIDSEDDLKRALQRFGESIRAHKSS